MDSAWVRAIIAPIIVGLIAGFLGSQASMAVHGERITSQGHAIEKLQVQVEDLRGLQVSMARVEVQMAHMNLTLERVWRGLESP
jgi:hypothetical protein